eukprot:scaffold92202_cov41-Prasinocladus_malaysianus.AAC.1
MLLQGEVAKGAVRREPREVTAIGITAWKEAALFTPVIRRFARLFMTPPPPRAVDEDGQLASNSKLYVKLKQYSP